METGAGGNEPGAGNFCIRLFREKGDGFITGNGLGFEQQRAAGLQGSKNITKRFDR